MLRRLLLHRLPELILNLRGVVVLRRHGRIGRLVLPIRLRRRRVHYLRRLYLVVLFVVIIVFNLIRNALATTRGFAFGRLWLYLGKG